MPTNTKRAAYCHYDGTAYRLTAVALRAIVAGAEWQSVARELRSIPATLDTDDGVRLYSAATGVQCIAAEDLDAGEAAYILNRLTK